MERSTHCKLREEFSLSVIPNPVLSRSSERSEESGEEAARNLVFRLPVIVVEPVLSFVVTLLAITARVFFKFEDTPQLAAESFIRVIPDSDLLYSINVIPTYVFI